MSCLDIDQIRLRNDYATQKDMIIRVGVMVRKTSNNKQIRYF